MTEAPSPGGVPGVSGGGRELSGRAALGLVLRSLVELQETKGVTPHRVYRHVAAGGVTRMTPGRLQLAMERAVRDGVLVQQRGRYNLNRELPVVDQAWGGGGGGSCGCGSSSKSQRKRSGSSKSRRKRSGSSKRCGKHGGKRGGKSRSRSRSRSRRRRSSSSKRRCRRRRKPICGQVSLYKRLMKLLFPKKRCSKRKKRQPYTWVRKHCRRNPNHSRNKRRGRR